MSGSVPAHVPVLIAGGGPVGLAAAVELGRRGVRCLVVEPRREVSTARPRCKTLNVRTMEHLRRWGLADRLRERAPLPVSWSQDVVFCTSLSGQELSRFTGVLGLSAQGDRFAETGQQAPQYVLEEVLREHVSELEPCHLMLGARVVAVDQNEQSATVWLRDEAGERFTVTADYVLGCDGPRSVVLSDEQPSQLRQQRMVDQYPGLTGDALARVMQLANPVTRRGQARPLGLAAVVMAVLAVASFLIA